MSEGLSNFEVALRAERKKVIRCFQHYDHNQRADMMASFRQGRRQRHATGRYFYVHPAVPGIAFPTRGAAAEYALSPSLESPQP